MEWYSSKGCCNDVVRSSSAEWASERVPCGMVVMVGGVVGCGRAALGVVPGLAAAESLTCSVNKGHDPALSEMGLLSFQR